MKEIFEFLDSLRDSGMINMFGAPKVLEDTFDMTKKESIDAFVAWTKYCEENA